jgi:hypothetical protein
MSNWLNFDDAHFEKGYKPFELTAENIKANKGKRIVYLLKKNIDAARGYAFPRYGVIHEKRYSQLLLDGGHDSIDLRDVVECGVEIEAKHSHNPSPQ